MRQQPEINFGDVCTLGIAMILIWGHDENLLLFEASAGSEAILRSSEANLG